MAHRGASAKFTGTLRGILRSHPQNQRVPKGPPNEDPPKSGLRVSVCGFFFPSPHELSVLKRRVPKTLAFAFGLRLRSKTRCFKTRVSGRRLPNGKPQERLRFRDLRSKTLAFKKRIAIISCVLEASLGARACVQVLCVQKRGVLRLRS